VAFRRLGEHEVHAWASFRLVTGSFEAPDGERFERTYLRHPGAVAVVPVDGASVVLVRQYRPALGRQLLEIPAGTLDKGAHESPAACAERELAEEVGAVAGSLVDLVSYAVAPGVSSEELHLFVATDLTFGETAADGIEEQTMTVERLAVADVDAAIADGRITDAKTIIGLLLARGRGLLGDR
jgi:8-oxo-dGTP pyrophosphatase MutT (NUDIX family)